MLAPGAVELKNKKVGQNRQLVKKPRFQTWNLNSARRHKVLNHGTDRSTATTESSGDDSQLGLVICKSVVGGIGNHGKTFIAQVCLKGSFRSKCMVWALTLETVVCMQCMFHQWQSPPDQVCLRRIIDRVLLKISYTQKNLPLVEHCLTRTGVV